MTFRLAAIAPVLLGVISAQAALGVMTPLIPLLLLRDGVSDTLIGIVASAYFVGFLGGALTADRVVSRVGHIRAFAVFAAAAADAALLMVFAHAAWEMALLRMMIGYACSGMFLVAESWLNDRAEPANRGRIFGAYLVASWGASAAGPLALNVVVASPLMFVLVGVAFATAVLPMALTVQANPTIRARAHMSLRELYRVSPVGVACAVASGLVNSSFYALAPVYVRNLGFGPRTVATFISTAAVAGLLVQVPVGVLSDRLGRRPMTLVTLAVGVVMAGAILATGRQPFVWLAAMGFVFAGATAPLYGLGAGQTNDRMERGDYVAASGALLFAWSLGSSCGPLLVGIVMESMGPSGLFVALLAVLSAVGLFTGLRMLQRGEVPAHQRSGFVPAPAAPVRSAELAGRVAWTLRHPLGAAPTWRALLHWPGRR